MSVQTPEKPAKAKREGVSTDDVKIEQLSDIVFPLNDPFEHPESIVVMSPAQAKKDFTERLAFADEPVEILVQPSSEKFGSKTVECWVNGKGIEYFDRQSGRWVEVGSIPRGVPVITKRKYVEILLRSKTTDVKTSVIEKPGEDPDNRMLRTTHATYPLQIVRDDNPRSRDWFFEHAGFNA